MKTNNEESTITGIVEHIIYRNAENGFIVFKISAKKYKDLITVVGNVVSVYTGETVIINGKWHYETKYAAMQFKATSIQTILPTSALGIEKYLSSGFIKGIGPQIAKRIVNEFGESTIDIIENDPNQLSKVNGVGKSRIGIITESWKENKITRDIMIFLQSYNITSNLAIKIYRKYGPDAISIVKSNPYKLAQDIRGIGFLSADKIALNSGIEPNSIIRANSAISYTLLEATSEGCCGIPIQTLLERTEKKLLIEKSILMNALNLAIGSNEIIALNLSQGLANISSSRVNSVTEESNEILILLPAYFYLERNIARKLLTLMIFGKPIGIDIDAGLQWLYENYKFRLSSDQERAIHSIVNSKITIITGGPGTGKTTLLSSLLKIIYKAFEGRSIRIKLVAPTGRAAKKLSESTKGYASTIHRLLEFDVANNRFKYNENHTLPCDIIIIDESSMVDVQLMSALLKAISPVTTVVFVGDVDQIPSVGPGQVLNDMINSNTIPVIKLNKIFRQAVTSNIVTNAHLINKNYMPKLDLIEESDFWFINNEPEDVSNSILNLVTNKIPSKFKNKIENFNPLTHIQVLSPMQRGSLGVKSLNIMLQNALNPNLQQEVGINRFGQNYVVGDKVMQIENNYDKNVFNGDIGYIVDINNEDIVVKFDGRGEVIYDGNDLDQLVLAYAITIHKSQGSEYPVVIIPIVMQHFIMLNKNLLYTAITRAKKLAVLVGQQKAVAIAVKNTHASVRYSTLNLWLQEQSKK